ncbi:SPT3 Dosage dependent suppressor of Ty-induced promoter mutations-like protein [Coniosporium apollinis]|uniref:SPT3 Dosage dependent suppressor of Ty-induced promoter mutations-like protein n=1 Tax=Coniosporium apollinis TaxID=61459 RepID=A0ABQ9NWG2_9PEZI|nr:SPT3 Dosage dependent suppressor of Ty-induced promoter mutations-like protein [Coniosporium apollinis]
MAFNSESFSPLVVDQDTAAGWNNGNDDYLFDSSIINTDQLDDSSLFGTPGTFGNAQPAATPGLLYGSPERPNDPSHDPPKTGNRQHGSLQPRSAPSSASPESSSQESASDTSSRRKRKTTSSNSSPSATFGSGDRQDKKDWSAKMDSMVNTENSFGNGDTAFNWVEPSNVLSMDTDLDSINRTMENHFDFESAASSPGAFGLSSADQSFMGSMPNQQSVYGQHVPQAMPRSTRSGAFFLGSRENSPLSAAMATSQEASPADMFNTAPQWALSPQNILIKSEQLYPNGLPAISPSPIMPNLLMQGMETGSSPAAAQLHIYPIASKSRVETQINIKMTLYPMPPGVTKLHLPTHTISKPKLLAKSATPAPDTLELHTMLVCTSAMDKPHFRQRAFQRAAGLDGMKMRMDSRRASSEGNQDDDPDSPDKTENGGEVRICTNCMNRERKRAGRKRVKKQEDEEEWYKYEQDRVIVFNTKEYQDWQPPTAPKENGEDVKFPEGAMQISAPMRIACYCRHHSEKIGFQVIFTIKDWQGRLVAQAITDSILITDDHKTHNTSGSLNGLAALADSTQFASDTIGFPEQTEMMPSSLQTSRQWHSTNNLDALRRNQPQFASSQNLVGLQNFHSHSTNTSATPRNLSRQASPSSQSGPNKKRKGSASSARPIPPSLSMTRLNDAATMQVPPVASAGPTIAGPSSNPLPWGPNTSGFRSPEDQSFAMAPVTVPHFNTGPPTPTSNPGLITPGHRSGSTDYPFQFYSAPSSAHPSRAASPVATNRPAMSAFQQHQQQQAQFASGLGNAINGLPFGGDLQQQQQQQPQIQQPQHQSSSPKLLKVLPSEGPITGGIEVTCLGTNFHHGLEVFFGDNVATTTTCWGSSSLVCLLPPTLRAGPVPVTLRQRGPLGPAPQPSAPSTFFNYVDTAEQQLFETALRFLCHKQTGSTDNYQQFARSVINSAATSSWGPPAGQAPNSGMQGYQAANFRAAGLRGIDTEQTLVNCLEKADVDDSPYEARINMRSATGATMLALAASLGYSRFVAGLLARGANPDARDKGGFTPLMFAAMRGHAQIVRRLILRGADPMMRSLRGFMAVDFTASDEMLNALQRVQHHTRSRSAGAYSPRGRTGSGASVHSVWNPSSPSQSSGYSSMYSDEDEEQHSNLSATQATPEIWIQSRRNSAALLSNDVLPLSTPPLDHTRPMSPAAAMAAWGDHLATQLQQFQQSMQWHLPNFQLPALPPMPNLPDYQAHPMVRRISSLMPHTIQSRSASATSDAPTVTPANYSTRDLFSTPVLPPSYEEIYPDNVDKDLDIKKSSMLQVAAETLLDQTCAERFDAADAGGSSKVAPVGTLAEIDVKIGKQSLSKEQQQQLRKAHAQRLKKIRSDRNLFFLWLPLLLIIVVAMLTNRIPEFINNVSKITTVARQYATGRIVEVA